MIRFSIPVLMFVAIMFFACGDSGKTTSTEVSVPGASVKVRPDGSAEVKTQSGTVRTGPQDNVSGDANFKISVPGVDLNSTGGNVQLKAPGVNLRTGPGGTNVKVPGVNVNVDSEDGEDEEESDE